METLLHTLGLSEDSGLGAWVSFLIALGLLLVLGTIVHRILIQQLHRLTQKTAATWDDELIANIKRPSYFMVLTLVVYFATQLSHLSFKAHPILSSSGRAAFVVFFFWTIERVMFSLVRSNDVLSSLTDSTRILISTVLRAGLLVLGLLMVLDSAGISITPLLASLGVGSVAVALALQDTLSNLFSGLYILADKPFQLGDFVEVEGGIQGYVVKVGWRSSRVRTTTNNVVVIPNSKLASSVLTNFNLDDKESMLIVPVGVSYDSDLDKVEAITLEVAKYIMAKIQPEVRGFEPFLRYREFADSSINFFVYLKARNFDDIGILRHEFVKALHKAYLHHGIEIPFPQRVLHMKGANV